MSDLDRDAVKARTEAADECLRTADLWELKKIEAYYTTDVPALLAALEEAERERDAAKSRARGAMSDYGEQYRRADEAEARAESAERRIAAAEAECELYDGHWVDHPEDTWRFHADIRAALHPVSETTEGIES